MAIVERKYLFQDKNIRSDYIELLPKIIANSYGYYVTQSGYLYKYLDNFIVRKEQDIRDVSYELVRPEHMNRPASIFGIPDLGYSADMSEEIFREFILWVRDILYKGASKDNISTFLSDRFNVDLEFSVNDDMLDYVDPLTWKQHIFEIVIRYDLGSEFSILTSKDLIYIIEQIGRLVPAYARSSIVTNPIVDEYITIIESIGTSSTSTIKDDMSFPYYEVDTPSGDITTPYSGYLSSTQPPWTFLIPYPASETEWRDHNYAPKWYRATEEVIGAEFQNLSPGLSPRLAGQGSLKPSGGVLLLFANDIRIQSSISFSSTLEYKRSRVFAPAEIPFVGNLLFDMDKLLEGYLMPISTIDFTKDINIKLAASITPTSNLTIMGP